ncbi:FecR family protein [Paracrocinitomix mangrovi]|uniref:FecR domain-containing protein n=1 Tax=Paracrocinitomix mangrovi TaxID=2862509 RepID=UPI001C8F0464|nr:FecR domain-containing protein [Paracrocinitomix mangrovi]UKN01074.1 FecR family protein [Paracrocinitomix mangrovi]
MTEEQIFAYLNRSLSNEEMIEVDLWIAKSSENMTYFNELRKKWSAQKKLQYQLEREAKYGSSATKSRQKREIPSEGNNYNSGTTIPEIKKPNKIIIFAFFAGLIALGGAISVFTAVKAEKDSGEYYESEMLELITTDQVDVAFLSDGSSITVYDHSTFYYPSEFEDGDRNVELIGSAYFDIVYDNGNDFIIKLPYDSYVETTDGAVQLTYDDVSGTTEVYVSEGSIKVYNDEEKHRMTQGAFGTFNNITGELELLTEGF